MRLYHISGAEAVLLYDYGVDERPRVGDSFYVRDAHGDGALVGQVVALETFSYPSLSEVVMRQMMEDSYGAEKVAAVVDNPNAPQVDNLGRCILKIRRRVLPDGSWTIWNGWLPSRNVSIERVTDDELFTACGFGQAKHPLRIGHTLDGRAFEIEGRDFEKVNVITALKGMGKSHLAKVLILQLIEQGMACIVFDVNREYLRLPRLEYEEFTSEGKKLKRATHGGVIVLAASEDLRITIESFGRRALLRLFESYQPSDPTRNVFEREVTRLFDQLAQFDLSNKQVPPERRQRRPFLNLDVIRNRFNPRTTQEHIYRAIMDRLDSIASLNLFAENEEEADSFDEAYQLCAQRGGALVVDLAPLASRFARETFVGATLDLIERMATSSAKLPFVFFEEAHLYTSDLRIDNLVTRARHLGITSTFVTNMVTKLNETVLRQVDNLFLLYLPHHDDVRHVAKSATTDEETVIAFAQRIEQHHAMVVGAATKQYPIVFRVAQPTGVDMAGETRYAFED
jgi:uncharacterized protein